MRLRAAKSLVAWLLAASMWLASSPMLASSYSNYYSDYLRPAKMALNMIQQTLQGNQQQQQLAQVSNLVPGTEPAAPASDTTNDPTNIITVTSSLASVTTSNGQPGDRWARVEESTATSASSGSTSVGSDVNEQVETTAAPISQSPTQQQEVTSSSETLATGSITELPASSSTIATTAETITTTTTTTETPTSSTTTASTRLSEQVERAKEAELEAIAAVEASIGFGGQLLGGGQGGGDLFGLQASTQDACYDEYGNARFCEPPFENIAFERQVEVSSECGQPPSRFCTAYSDQLRNCHMCNAANPKKRHPASYLTDMNNSNDPTCWVSAPIAGNGNVSSSNFAQQQQREDSPLKADNVSLVLKWDKRYEIVYVSLQFCSLKPDSLAIYKSPDFGLSWQPYQFYSSQCRRMYNRPQSSYLPGARRPANPASLNSNQKEPEAQCTNATSSGSLGRVAFSPLEGRHQQLENSSRLQQWATATGIRISLDRHQPQWIHSSLHSASLAASANTSADMNADLTSPSDTFNYAVSDLTIGGRCKCNGHASRCVHAKDGRLQCDCRHNTAGRDCDRCAPFHFDRPWARASQLDANPCQPCNCNGHSRKCRFDPELYRLSPPGRRSGGVCMSCRDNTAGRHCHYCKEGYTRDHSKPMNDKEACKECACHPIGSLGRVCNQTTGQCPCKEGVAGPQCSRCAPGYQQSSSPSEPCIKLLEAFNENDINSDAERPPAAPPAQTQDANSATQEQPSVETMAPRATPVVGSRRPTASSDQAELEPPQLMLGAADDPNDQDQDQDLEEASEQQVRPMLNPRAHWSQQPLFSSQRKHTSKKYHWPQFVSADDDAETDEQVYQRRPLDQATSYYEPAHRPAIYQHPYKSRYLNEFQQSQAARRQPQPAPTRLLPELSQLYPEQELQSLQPDGANLSGGAASGQPMYSENFNQIQAADLSRLVPHRNHHNQHHQQSLQWGSRSATGKRFKFNGAQTTTSFMQAPSSDASACNDCRRTMRRVSQRQFCHLDYAIKAIVLSYQVAEDWTKVEVRVEDIFKSPASGGQQQQQTATGDLQLPATSTNYLDNMLQSDEPQQQQLMLGGSSNNNTGDLVQHSRQQQQHRAIMVGTSQLVWVPTEDFICRCPKLKVGAVYLLMGGVEAKPDQSVSLQLDRHGVSYEWRSSSLQEKLIGFQQRQTLGRCSSSPNQQRLQN